MVIKKIWQGWHKGIFLLLALPILRFQFPTPSKLIKQQSEDAPFHGHVKLKPMKGVYHGRLLECEILQNVFVTQLPDYHQLRQRKRFKENRLIGSNAPPKRFFIPNVGVRMLDGQATDVLEGSSLSFQSEYIDIYSNCWGPKDDGKTFGKPGKLAQEALMQGALKVKLLVRRRHVWCVVYLTKFESISQSKSSKVLEYYITQLFPIYYSSVVSKSPLFIPSAA